MYLLCQPKVVAKNGSVIIDWRNMLELFNNVAYFIPSSYITVI